jgi:hypothetical protein
MFDSFIVHFSVQLEDRADCTNRLMRVTLVRGANNSIALPAIFALAVSVLLYCPEFLAH